MRIATTASPVSGADVRERIRHRIEKGAAFDLLFHCVPPVQSRKAAKGMMNLGGMQQSGPTIL
jgi:hypothetical protein